MKITKIPGPLSDALEGRILKIRNFDGTAFTGRCRGTYGAQIPAMIADSNVALNFLSHVAFDNEPDDAYPLARIESIEEVKS